MPPEIARTAWVRQMALKTVEGVVVMRVVYFMENVRWGFHDTVMWKGTGVLTW